MASSVVHSSLCFVVFFSIAVLIPTSSGQLTANYYDSSCPNVIEIVRDVVQKAINCDRRMGASLLRLHFHDCWVNGCDGSVLLVNRPWDGFVGEQSAIANFNSLRGFDVIAAIKSALNQKCRCGNVVSCADILAIAASESVRILEGPCYQVLLGRKDSLTASEEAANTLPNPFSDVSTLLANYAYRGFGAREFVALSGGHTIGRARCDVIRGRIYSNQSIDPDFAKQMQDICGGSSTADDGGNTTAPLDSTPDEFDKVFFQMLTQQKGLLDSDQVMYSGGDQTTAGWVKFYSGNQPVFWQDFGYAMIKMGNLPPADNNGEIRCNCSIPNSSTQSNALSTLAAKLLKCPSPPITCPSCPLVSLSSLFNIGKPPSYCPTPVTCSSSPSTSPPSCPAGTITSP